MSDNPFAGKARSAAPADREADDFLGNGGRVTAKFPTENFTVEGTILGWSKPFQATHIDSGEPLFWEGKKKTEESKLRFEASKENPVLQMPVELQCVPTGVTWETNRYKKVAVPDDDGVRTLYVAGAMRKAIAKARRDADNAPLEVGAYLKVTRGEDVKMPNDYYGFTFTAEWTRAEDNKHYKTESDGFLEEDPFEDNAEPAL
jgi:hypothetical protein